MINYDLSLDEIKKLKTNPTANPDSIVIIKQPDGNYRGFMSKNGKIIQCRVGEPNTALNELITHG